MSIKTIDKETGDIGELIAGGTLYADLAIGDMVSSGRASDNPAPGFLYCDGRALSRTDYADLFQAIGTSFGSGDGSTTFNIPDMRGEFIRGAGTNNHANQGDGGTVGQHQDATSHLNTRWGAGRPYIGTPDSSGPFMSVNNSDTTTEPYHWLQEVQPQYGATSEDPASTYDSRYTSRPTNTSVNFFIKAEQVAIPADFISAMDNIYGVLIPSNASSSNKLTTMTEVKTLFTTPLKRVLGINIPTTFTVDSTYNHLVHVKAQLKDFIPDGYKLYKATLDISWTNGNSYDSYLAEVISMGIATTTSGENKEAEFALITRTEQTLGATYSQWNAYACTIECVKE